MDDQKFDDIIRRKAGDYKEPEFDPAALASLHHQMAASILPPWYARYRTELLVGTGILVCTIIVLGSQWYRTDRSAHFSEEGFRLIKEQNEQIAELQNEIRQLKALHPDTVWMAEFNEQQTPLYGSLVQKIAHLEALLQNTRRNDANDAENAVRVTGYAVPAGFPARPYHSEFGAGRHIFLAGSLRGKRDDGKPSSSNDLSGALRLPARTIRDLERHYHKGLGVKVGPSLELSQGFYANGEGIINIGGGLLTDLILSSSFSLESGVKYAKKTYGISDPADLANAELPDVEQRPGDLQGAEVDSWIVEVPFHLKYRRPLTLRTHWIAGVGYSSLIFVKQAFEYSYEPLDGDDFFISSAYKTKDIAIDPGVVSVSFGLDYLLKNKKVLETSVYYQRSLGASGVEGNSYRYLGARAVYWFTVR